MRYLLEWVHQLHGRSGFTPIVVEGFVQLTTAPATWSSLESWSRFTGNIPDEEDIDPLFELDAILCNPG